MNEERKRKFVRFNRTSRNYRRLHALSLLGDFCNERQAHCKTAWFLNLKYTRIWRKNGINN